MASITDVVNRALDLLGHTPVASIDDTGETAGLLRRNLPQARQATLRAYPWNVARRRVLLPAAGAAPAFDFPLAYPLPAGPSPLRCLRVLHVGRSPAHTRWRVEGRLILTDEPAPLPVEYVGDVEDASEWDALLSEAVSIRLAMMIGWRMVGSESRVQALTAALRDAIREARAIDAKEQSQDEAIIADDWLTQRVS